MAIDTRRFWRRLGIALKLRDPPHVPKYGWSYFDHLVAVYVTLDRADKRADAVIKKSKEEPDNLTWGDIFLLENVIFKLQPPEAVDRSAWIVRERLREIACPTVFAKYAESGVPVETNTPEKLALVRADLTRVLDVLHWHYSLIPMRERMRKALTQQCMGWIICYSVVLVGALIWLYRCNFDFVAMLCCVIYWGIIGGFVSSQRRMQSLPSDGDPIISVFGLDSAGYYLWLSPLLGAVFAVMLMMMFISGMIEGSVFPRFARHQPSPEAMSFFNTLAVALPQSRSEYGKLFVWAFLAGFAERLVPDSLDRLSSKLTPGSRPGPDPIPKSPLPGGGGAPQERETRNEIAPEILQDALHTGERPEGEGGGDGGR